MNHYASTMQRGSTAHSSVATTRSENTNAAPALCHDLPESPHGSSGSYTPALTKQSFKLRMKYNNCPRRALAYPWSRSDEDYFCLLWVHRRTSFYLLPRAQYHQCCYFVSKHVLRPRQGWWIQKYGLQGRLFYFTRFQIDHCYHRLPRLCPWRNPHYSHLLRDRQQLPWAPRRFQ